ncbi:HpcH/HpaI aldolase/citrate lyase family protein [Nitrososphaera viennensis]|uniref:CoA ester lyase n=2 Tax=Nitrososphaera viennensis TaxID=1034015 RepID=A0A977NLD9_9ARCH|nr:CoA ester lyase [Nitrososphaera viennensis]AIC16708.1 putative citrate/ citryl-CoA lyase [Nitrososphaera viennensis EN76]UVS68628.1 CoA ester lyase [Nitrososphaera viennensis]
MMFRTLIFVPGANARFIEKAKALAADIICFDLEDSVPANEKETARKVIAGALAKRQEYQKPVYVRTNSPESGLIQADIEAVVQKGIDGLVIPKVNDANEVIEIARAVSALEKERGTGKIALIPSIETAKGVVNTYAISSVDDRVNAVVFGVFDFLHDMRMDYDERDDSGYAYARARIPVDARAAGVAAIDAIWQKVDDIDGLVQDATAAKRLGYSGKSIIHPGQIEPVHRVFLPSKSEIEWAKKVVAALGEAMEKGTGRLAVRLEGRMVDAVHYKQAKAILEAAAAGSS